MKKYFMVIGQLKEGDKWACQFGDYKRAIASDELNDMADSGDWYDLRLITGEGANDAQIMDKINAKIAKLNEGK
jgi:hypothetical protein